MIHFRHCDCEPKAWQEAIQKSWMATSSTTPRHDGLRGSFQLGTALVNGGVCESSGCIGASLGVTALEVGADALEEDVVVEAVAALDDADADENVLG